MPFGKDHIKLCIKESFLRGNFAIKKDFCILLAHRMKYEKGVMA